MRNLKHGNLGWDVAILQLRLDLWMNGYFDDRTVKAVKAFQKAHRGLEVDGEVGPKTRKALELKPVETAMPFHPRKLWLALVLGEKDLPSIAKKEIGERAWPGEYVTSARIKEYLQTTTINVTTDETPWCSAFVNWVMRQSRRIGTDSAAASSWLKWEHGTVVTTPEYGDIVVIKLKKHRPEISGYHVAFFISKTNTHITLLGGNQGGMVRESLYPLSEHEAPVYIRPKGHGSTALLKIGSAKGGCTLKGYEGCLPLATFTNGLERNVSMATGVAGRGPGVPQFETVSMTRVADGSVISLFGMALKGSAGVDATISFLSANGRETLKYVYRNAILTDYHMAGAADETATEGISFSYSRVEVTYTPYDAAGKAGNPVRLAYDVGAAKLA